MYIIGRNDKVWEVPVWGRFGKTKDRVVIARLYRHTLMEAEAYVTGLGYTLVRI